MSTRTIIEINHDFLRDLAERPLALQTFIASLAGAVPVKAPPGINILGTRHHSDKLVVKIGDWCLED